MSRDEQDLWGRILGSPGRRLPTILRGLLAGVVAGAIIFFDIHHVLMAVGYAVAIALFVVIGWNISTNVPALDGRSAGAVRPPMRFREASAGTQVLTVLGLLVLVSGLWMIRHEQSVIGIPVLMVALIPLFLVRHRVTGTSPGWGGPVLHQ